MGRFNQGFGRQSPGLGLKFPSLGKDLEPQSLGLDLELQSLGLGPEQLSLQKDLYALIKPMYRIVNRSLQSTVTSQYLKFSNDLKLQYCMQWSLVTDVNF